MTPIPILKVLSTLTYHQVRYLLMGGQACVFYEGTDFSIDTDIVIVADTENLDRLQAALTELRARCIAVPPFEAEYLHRGHAVHFRCQRPDADAMRLDVMSVLRGVDSFDRLWDRRTSLEIESGTHLELLGLDDLIRAKKTQRDKDWVMIRKMLARHYRRNRACPTEAQVRFWLEEGRSPQMVAGVVNQFPGIAGEVAKQRPLVAHAIAGDTRALARGLQEEERLEREADRLYWLPLKAELEQIRLNRFRQN